MMRVDIHVISPTVIFVDKCLLPFDKTDIGRGFGTFSSIGNTFSPCHGRLPRRKYMNMWPKASRSSRRLCSVSTDFTRFHRDGAKPAYTINNHEQSSAKRLTKVRNKSYLCLSVCWWTCIEQFQSSSYAPGMECVFWSRGRCILWPGQSQWCG